jgi:carboxyl-terminal processing protease
VLLIFVDRRMVRPPETFNFLGFTFVCGTSRRGQFLIKRKTRRDRIRAKLKELKWLTLNPAVEKMRGPENSKIKLKIMRKGQDKPIEISITRARIQVRSVRSRLEGDDVGFIRVTQFNEQTTEGLKKAITDLTAQAGDKLKGFIIDLRNNPGGLLDQAISVSDAFLEKGEIVSTRGRNAEETQWFNARGGGATSPRTSRSSC